MADPRSNRTTEGPISDRMNTPNAIDTATAIAVGKMNPNNHGRSANPNWNFQRNAR